MGQIFPLLNGSGQTGLVCPAIHKLVVHKISITGTSNKTMKAQKGKPVTCQGEDPANKMISGRNLCLVLLTCLDLFAQHTQRVL